MMRSLFNWLAEPPKHNFTLGELFRNLAGKYDPEAIIDHNPFGFSRLGRFLERGYSSVGLAGSVAVFMTAPTPSPAVAFMAAAGCMALWKTAGVVVGKATDFLVRGISRKFEAGIPKNP